MIETLGGLVSNIAIIVILAVFVEMLLPNNSTAKYLRLIMGLFIIVTLLAPLMNFLERDSAYEVATWNFSADNRQLASILKTGEEIILQNNEKAAEEYKKRIEGQIIALVRLLPEIESVKSEVTLYSNDDIRFGGIQNVVLWVTSSEENFKLENEGIVTEIDPIEIDLSSIDESELGKKEESKDLNKIEMQIKETLGSFFGLEEEQIQVNWNLGG